jgi:hypothetical protein
MDAFEFKRYDMTVATARNLDELKEQMNNLRSSDPSLVNWHLEQGHIQSWLEYAGYKDEASKLKGVTTVDEAIKILSSSSGSSNPSGIRRNGPMGKGRKRMGPGMNKK